MYEAVVMALERLDERTLCLVTKLLAALHASVVVTPNQMKEGFARVSAGSFGGPIMCLLSWVLSSSNYFSSGCNAYVGLVHSATGKPF